MAKKTSKKTSRSRGPKVAGYKTMPPSFVVKS
jgi:hypothetical protein